MPPDSSRERVLEEDRDFFEDDQCWNCGGEGYVANCQDEIACMYPEDGCDLCMRRCEYCNPRSPPQSRS
jgi:hypothetical protein